MGASLDGVLVVDKPAGPTSHDVVDRVREAFGLRRVGHTGTLDPFATGVLPVCLGKCTRLARFLGEGEKLYRATVRLGFPTTTDDATGQAMGEPRAVRLERGALEAALARLTGPLHQVPPAYSAKRVSGRRLYELARRGEAGARVAAAVTVHAITLLASEDDRVDLEIRCSPGTYVRALARDLGEMVGVGGHLTALRRLRSGAFGLEDAVAMAEVDPAARESVIRRVIPLSGLLREIPGVRVGPEGRTAVRHGRDLGHALVVEGFPERPPARVRVIGEDGELLALAVPRGFGPSRPGLPIEPVLHPDVVLAE
jgi:tRNA pseudouridine55 synthase